MSYERLAYDDQDTAGQMRTDCSACASAMAIMAKPIAVAALEGAPSISYADFPREIRKPVIRVSDAAAHLAARLHLHVD